MNRKNQICTLNLSDWAAITPLRVTRASGSTQKRLAEAFAFLENLDLQRANGQDRLLGKVVEDRIIWRELLELELQEIDEQIEQISAAAAENSD